MPTGIRESDFRPSVSPIRLTHIEHAVLQDLVRGCNLKGIAHERKRSPYTVSLTIQRVKKRCKITSTYMLIYQLGLYRQFESELHMAIKTYRIFTNDRGRVKGVAMYSALCDMNAYTAKEAEGKVNPAFGASPFAPIRAIEWPATSPESKDWLAKHT